MPTFCLVQRVGFLFSPHIDIVHPPIQHSVRPRPSVTQARLKAAEERKEKDSLSRVKERDDHNLPGCMSDCACVQLTAAAGCYLQGGKRRKERAYSLSPSHPQPWRKNRLLYGYQFPPQRIGLISPIFFTVQSDRLRLYPSVKLFCAERGGEKEREERTLKGMGHSGRT